MALQRKHTKTLATGEFYTNSLAGFFFSVKIPGDVTRFSA
jgi:hypothetical protein